jgi:hypothetical protein
VSNLQGGRDLGDGRGPAGDASPFPIRPAERREVHAALQMILGVNGRPAAEEHVVDFLRFAVYRGIDLNDIWVATDAGQLIWAVLPVVSPGRTMLLFSPSFVPSAAREACAAQLIARTLEHHQDRAGG